MFDNLPIQPKPSTRWSAGLAFILLAFGLGVHGFFRTTAPEFNDVWGLLSAVRGGDVVVVPEPLPPPPPRTPVERPSSTPPGNFLAESIAVKDPVSGALLFEKDAYAPRPIASITKLMSALVLLDAGPLPMTATATVAADMVIDTHMYAGDTYTVADLWHAMLVGSSNKAVLTLVDAQRYPRDAFVARMNEKAIALGMTQTVFFDPTGLDERNVSTASDVMILLKEALGRQTINEALAVPAYTLFSSERGVTHEFWNTNWLLLGWIPHTFSTVRGGKTGYIPSSGYNFAVEVLDEHGRALQAVVLGAPSHEARFTEARDALEWTFENFVWPADTP